MSFGIGATGAREIRPVVYLKADSVLSSGNGTSDSPYILG